MSTRQYRFWTPTESYLCWLSWQYAKLAYGRLGYMGRFVTWRGL